MKKPDFSLSQAALILSLTLGCAQTAAAFDWTSSNIQLLYGKDFELGDDDRATVTIEHANGWQYGGNFFFVDIIPRNDIGVEVYAEVYTYLSFKKISGFDVELGPIKDISLMAGLNISNKPEDHHFQAYVAGISFDLANPYFDYLQLDVAAYKTDNVSGKYGVQITPVWSVPFSIGEVKFKFRGFTDFRTGNTNLSGNFNILSQPQLLVDIGDLAGWKSDKLYFGTEYFYWYRKFGIDKVEESAVQAMFLANF